MQSPHLRSHELCSTCQTAEIYINYLEFFCMDDLSPPHLSIYSIIYISMNSWIFISYPGYNPMLIFYFVALIVFALAIRSSWTVGFYVPLAYPHNCSVCCSCFSVFYFWALPFWYKLSHAPVLESTHFSRISYFFFFNFWLPWSIWSSWARDQIWASVTAQATTPGLGNEPESQHSQDATSPIVPQPLQISGGFLFVCFCFCFVGNRACFFLSLTFESSLFILYTNPLSSDGCFAKSFSQSVICLFIYLTAPFAEQKFVILIMLTWSVFFFHGSCFSIKKLIHPQTWVM